MAKRKKTPDVLAEHKSKAQKSTLSDEHERQPSLDQPVRAPMQEEEQSSSNPYAALFPPQPASNPPSPSARVKLEVTASQDIAQKVRHCMSQALRTLPDMQLVQEKADWTLIILGVPIQPPGGKIHGIALSAVATTTFDHLQADESRTRQGNRKDSTSEAPAIPPGVLFRGTWLRIGALAHVQKLCEQLVGDFSRRYLSPHPNTGGMASHHLESA